MSIKERVNELIKRENIRAVDSGYLKPLSCMNLNSVALVDFLFFQNKVKNKVKTLFTLFFGKTLYLA